MIPHPKWWDEDSTSKWVGRGAPPSKWVKLGGSTSKWLKIGGFIFQMGGKRDSAFQMGAYQGVPDPIWMKIGVLPPQCSRIRRPTSQSLGFKIQIERRAPRSPGRGPRRWISSAKGGCVVIRGFMLDLSTVKGAPTFRL
jgi:hypothetical protein